MINFIIWLISFGNFFTIINDIKQDLLDSGDQTSLFFTFIDCFSIYSFGFPVNKKLIVEDFLISLGCIPTYFYKLNHHFQVDIRQFAKKNFSDTWIMKIQVDFHRDVNLDDSQKKGLMLDFEGDMIDFSMKFNKFMIRNSFSPYIKNHYIQDGSMIVELVIEDSEMVQEVHTDWFNMIFGE